MKLYWGPHTCAIGIHVLLEEIGRPYTLEKIDVAGGDTQSDRFRAINPKAKVPALSLDDGRVLTEFDAIGVWLARRDPEAGLMPSDPDEECRALSITAYVTGTLHLQGFGRIFKPARYEPQDMAHQALRLGQGSVKRQGEAMVRECLAILERELAGRSWAAGGRFGVADAALFYATRWAPETGIALPPNLDAHLRRVKERPAVRRVLAAWGEE